MDALRLLLAGAPPGTLPHQLHPERIDSVQLHKKRIAKLHAGDGGEPGDAATAGDLDRVSAGMTVSPAASGNGDQYTRASPTDTTGAWSSAAPSLQTQLPASQAAPTTAPSQAPQPRSSSPAHQSHECMEPHQNNRHSNNQNQTQHPQPAAVPPGAFDEPQSVDNSQTSDNFYYQKAVHLLETRPDSLLLAKSRLASKGGTGGPPVSHAGEPQPSQHHPQRRRARSRRDSDSSEPAAKQQAPARPLSAVQGLFERIKATLLGGAGSAEGTDHTKPKRSKSNHSLHMRKSHEGHDPQGGASGRASVDLSHLGRKLLIQKSLPASFKQTEVAQPRAQGGTASPGRRSQNGKAQGARQSGSGSAGLPKMGSQQQGGHAEGGHPYGRDASLDAAREAGMGAVAGVVRPGGPASLAAAQPQLPPAHYVAAAGGSVGAGMGAGGPLCVRPSSGSQASHASHSGGSPRSHPSSASQRSSTVVGQGLFYAAGELDGHGGEPRRHDSLRLHVDELSVSLMSHGVPGEVNADVDDGANHHNHQHGSAGSSHGHAH